MTSLITDKLRKTTIQQPDQTNTTHITNDEKKGLTVKGQVISVLDSRTIINLDLQIIDPSDPLKTTLAIVRLNEKGEFKFHYTGKPISKFKANVLAPKCGVYSYESTRKVFDSFTIEVTSQYDSNQQHKEVFKTPFQVNVMEAAYTLSKENKPQFPKTPALYIFKKEHVPDLVDFNFLFTLGKGALPEIAKSAMVKAKEIFTKVSTEEIQRIFTPSKEAPKHTIETLVNLLLGFNDPHVFIEKSRESKQNNEFTYEVDLKKYKKEQDFKGVGLPEYLKLDLAIKKKDGKEYLDVTKITIQHPKFGENPVSKTSESKEFKELIAYSCDTLFTLGEIDTHLTRGHLVPGYFAFLIIRNFILEDNPLLELFTEFAKGIMRINFLGAEQIFSAQKGIFKETNLPQESLDELMTECFTQGSYNATPRKPLGAFDNLGQVKEILFKIASQAREFLKDKRKIIETSKPFLHEIWRASEDMRGYGLKNTKIPENEKKSWVDGSERPSPDGSYAFEPIMTKEGVFGDIEWEKLNNFSVYFIYSVLYHHIIHTAQEIFAAFPEIYSLSGRSEEGVSSESAMAQLIFKNVLINFEKEVETLLENEKVPKVFKDALKASLDALKVLLVDGTKFGITVSF